MLSRVLNLFNRLSLVDPIMRVNKLFFHSTKNQDLVRLENNFVFRHACLTPLTILSCSLDNLKSQKNKKVKEENIENAKQAVKHLTQLISSITDVKNKIDSFEIGIAITEVLQLFKNKNNCEIFYTNYLPKKLKLSGSKLFFQEIIICLLNNAYEAYKDKKHSHISLSVRIIKGQVFIGIVDFAKGMTNFAQKLALVRGISYKEHGLGLGLFFVKQTVENEFKGTFKIISGYGVGTHVQITFPIPEPYSQSLLQS